MRFITQFFICVACWHIAWYIDSISVKPHPRYLDNLEEILRKDNTNDSHTLRDNNGDGSGKPGKQG